MADTVKKSRIVSDPGECLAAAFGDEDASLQDIINEEFNQRLKSCMRDSNEDHIAVTYEPGEVVLKNGDHKTHSSQHEQQEETTLDLNTADLETTVLTFSSNEVLIKDSKDTSTNITSEEEKGLLQLKQDHSTNGLHHSSASGAQLRDSSIQAASLEDNFVNKEVPSPEEDIETPFDNVTVTDVDNENLSAKERFLSTVKDIEEDEDTKLATIKDRMFLSTDSACLLFTQTVLQSPMLTPTEENYDFLQGLRQNSSPDEISSAKNEEMVTILQDLAVNTDQEDLIDKPDNLERVETEANEDFSEISAENEVCNKLESSNSEQSEDLIPDEPQEALETHENEENRENIKDITCKFIINEIREIENNISVNKPEIFKQNPTIIEHLVEDIDPDNDEIIEDYSIPQSEVVQIEETNSSPTKVSEISKIFTQETEEAKEETKSPVLDESFDDIKKISKIFAPKDSADLKEEIKSPVLEESFEDVKKISKIFAPQDDDLKEEIKSPVLEESFEDIKKISKIFAPKDDNLKEEIKSPVLEESFEDIKKISKIFAPKDDDLKEEIKSPVLEESFEDIKKISKIFAPKDSDDLKEEIKSPVLEESFDDIKKISKIFAPKDSDDLKEEIKSPVLEESFEDIRKISKIFAPKDSDDLKEEIKSPVLEESFEDIKKTKEIFERISSGSEETPVLKSCDLVKRLSDPQSPGSESSEFDTNLVCRNNVSTTVTNESTFVETRTETNSNQDKVLKKKKSKKSKKDNEKENISVCDTNTNDEDNLSHVSVKNLCRSFSDLTSIGSKKAEVKIKTRISYGRTKSMSDIRREDVNLENVFSNVSVKSLKSSFSKFDALQKKTVLHVRSSDSGKAQEKFNGSAQIDTSSCKSCGKQVFQMEQMKAEKAIWHKNCFRCQECNKQLNVDTYQSNEGVLYCKPHFKALFTPKAVEDEPQPMRPRKHEMIIRENQPRELPPDVVRASDKPDLGLEELQNLNVKERFQVFEHHEDPDNNLERTASAVNVKRSPSILSKLAKFQSKGMNVGVTDDSLNGVPVEESSSEEEEEEEEELDGEDVELVRARRAQREKPIHFSNMSDVMSKWESGNQMTKEERREERKQEIQSIRSRLFMGKQAKIKEMYQQAVLDSSSGAHVRKQVPLDSELSESARSLRERFERGEQLTSAEQQTLTELDDAAVFETGISKKSRSIFLELDANASKPPSLKVVSPGKGEVRRAREAFMARQASEDVVKASDQLDDVEVKTADISSRFKFFETYKEPEKHRKQFRITPPRDGQPEQVEAPAPEAVELVDDTQEATAAHTATRMLSVFRQMEESAGREQTPAGPKPLKRFTPPPESQRTESESDEEYSEDEEEDEDEQRVVDDDLIEAQKAARAKHLRAKFEKWEANEVKREQNNSSVNIAEEMADADSQIESAKSLRARFESMRETPSDKERTSRVKVNRFVDTTNNVETCKSCEGRVYPLEKVSCHNNVYHKNCFRCRECNTILRMDSYTYNQGLLYCLPHFKRLFISKGNYEAGFGLDQHKEKWNSVA